MPDVLQTTFDVTVNGDTYTFKIPTIRYDMEVGYKSSEVRRRAYPEGMGALTTTDMATVQFSRACAILELYLVSATATWPFGSSDDPAAFPKVDFERFPVDRTEDVYDIGNAFETEVTRFRRRGNTNVGSTGA